MQDLISVEKRVVRLDELPHALLGSIDIAKDIGTVTNSRERKFRIWDIKAGRVTNFTPSDDLIQNIQQFVVRR